jgi:hypothetical protein
MRFSASKNAHGHVQFLNPSISAMTYLDTKTDTRQVEVGKLEQAASMLDSTPKLGKQRYRLFRRRGGVFYTFNNATGKQISLKTTEEAEAARPFHKN